MKCVRAGCSGCYGPEGYCDECGLRAPTGVVPVGAAGPDAGGPDAGGPGRGVPAPAGAPVSAAVAAGTVSQGGAWSGSGTGGTATTRSRASRRGQLGAGLVDVPRVPPRDPATVVMADPKVAENRRFCTACEHPVGRGGLDEGFCPHCRARFSFLPRLGAGDRVAGRYEIAGCLAYGGLGWIYLGKDHHIGDEVTERWVVLKGLINTEDPDAMAAAVTERRFLVEVDHPNIVQIFDFVQHPDPHTGAPVSYIVMEYVGGRSLRDLRYERGPLPLPEVLAYGLEVLPALGYLHERGLLFCDFKPDNVIHAEEQLKLIDLGAVRRADDQVSAVYGTPGYQAYEVPDVGPSIASDLYTVGRSLAVLSFDFRFSSAYANQLPDPADVPLLAAQESYHRLLLRATHADPRLRFQSAGEMAEQVYGVLREVLSAADGVSRPAPSTLFTPERRVFGTEAGDATGAPGGAMPPAAAVLAGLPLPAVDAADPAASYLATIGAADPDTLLAALAAAPVRSVEVRLRLARAHVECGQVAGARTELDGLAEDHPYDWRVDWYRGLAALVAGEPKPARAAFDAVYRALPGELAGQLALAVAAEYAGDKESAGAYYARVWRTDHGFVSAAFGLTRILFDRGDRDAAVAILDQVPESSSAHLAAQVAAVRVRLGAPPGTLTETDLLDASARLERLDLDAERRARMAVELIHSALRWVLAARRTIAAPVLGHPVNERALRFGLERSYRDLAKLSRDRHHRAAFADLANAVRPRTLV